MAGRSEIQLLISRIPLRPARSRPETLGRRINHDAKGFEVRVRVCGTTVINRRTSADEGYWRSPPPLPPPESQFRMCVPFVRSCINVLSSVANKIYL